MIALKLNFNKSRYPVTVRLAQSTCKLTDKSDRIVNWR